jgi:hypothetical protein
MQANSESLLYVSQWYQDDPTISAAWTGSIDSSLPEPNLRMALLEAPQDTPRSQPGTFFPVCL